MSDLRHAAFEVFEPRFPFGQVVGRDHNQPQPLCRSAQVGQRNVTGPFILPRAIGRVAFALGQQRRQATIAGPIRGIGEDHIALGQHNSTADQRADMRLFRLHIEPHDPRKRVVIRHAKRIIACLPRGLHQITGL